MSSRTLVVTGVNGFVGGHVARLAERAGMRVWGIGREPAPRGAAAYLDEYFSADLQQEWPIRHEVDAVVHLAGLAAVGPSFGAPQRYIAANSAIMTTVSEALLKQNARTRLIVVSSGAVYASPSGGSAIDEEYETVPTSPYAVAKLAVETQAAYYRTRGLDTLVARPFNHIGPGQGPGFLIPDLADALRTRREGESIRVGRLETERDYTDVRDVATAYITLAAAESHKHTIYNVASGSARSGAEILQALSDAMDIAAPPVEADPGRYRPTDPLRIVGDSTRLRQEFGWCPRVSLRQSLTDYLSGAVS